MSNYDGTVKNEGLEKYFYRASGEDFKKIPGGPIAYWVSKRSFDIFGENQEIGDVADARVGLQTSDNNRFLRCWHEISLKGIFFNASNRIEALQSNLKWFPCNKGGEFKKWFGNHFFVVNWANDGEEIRNFRDDKGSLLSRPQNMEFYFREAVSWSDVTSSSNAFRYFPNGFINDATGHSAFGGDYRWKLGLLAYCNNKYVNQMAKILNPTMHFHIGYFNKLPYAKSGWNNQAIDNVKQLISLSRIDWNSYEFSWNFTKLPLLNLERRQPTIKVTYQQLRAYWSELTLDVQRLEEENNRIFINAYGLQGELKPEVPLNEITLTCNPWYRYSRKLTTEHTENTENNHSKNSVCSVYSVVKKSFPIDDELEALLLADTMRELVSYAVGCMFGRYALDKPGLILANQGETIEDYYEKIGTTEYTEHMEHTEGENLTNKNSVSSVYSVVKNSFEPDKDNVIPMLDGDWFTDDISERFREFLKVSFGSEHYEANLRFVEDALGKDIRKYFLKDFYNDHVRRYKKRPIYWLFSSPKGSFNALIYMHRYRPDTVSLVLNDYLREFRTKLTSHKKYLEAVSISASASQTEKTKALKEIEKITKMIAEMEEYEREVLYPLATEQVEIDLDDGVKVNYPKLGAALKKIPGLDAKADE